MMSSLVIGCATSKRDTKPAPVLFNAQDLTSKMESGVYGQKVDIFMVILDASG
jgi:hypothetical protein